MEQATVLTPTQVIAKRVREVRKRRGLSAARLAEKLVEVGVPWDRGTVAKLETGRRASVSVADLLALAYVLDVAPVHLMVPIEGGVEDVRVKVADDITPGPLATRGWIRGLVPLAGQDSRAYFSEVPAEEFSAARQSEIQQLRQLVDELDAALSDGDRAQMFSVLRDLGNVIEWLERKLPVTQDAAVTDG